MEPNQPTNNQRPESVQAIWTNLRIAGIFLVIAAIVSLLFNQDVFAFVMLFFGQLFYFSFIVKNGFNSIFNSVVTLVICGYCFVSLFTMI